MTEFVRDDLDVPAPEPRARGVGAVLSAELESLAVGESGVVSARLETVRSLVSRHVRDRRAQADAVVGEVAGQMTYTKQFAVRALAEPGKVRVWRVA